MFNKILLILLIIIPLSSFSELNGIHLQLELEYKKVNNSVIFLGYTNLPNGTKLGINLQGPRKYYAQDFDIIVKNGHYESQKFTSAGKPLIGDFQVELFTILNKHWQSQETLSKLQTYIGPQIKNERIEIIKNISFGSGEEKSKIKEKIDAEEKTNIKYEKLLIKYYNELMLFKDDSLFHFYGFGTAGKYHKWMEDVERLRNSKNLNMKLEIAFGDLLQLGSEYFKTNGEENDFTKFCNESIKEFSKK